MAITSSGAATAAPTRSAVTPLQVSVMSMQLIGNSATATQKINVNDFKTYINADVDKYWSWATVGRTDVKVVSTKSNVRAKTANRKMSTGQLMSSVIRDAGFKPVKNRVTVVIVPEASLAGSTGFAQWYGDLNSGLILMPQKSTLSKAALIHEFGHIFGIDHANTLSCGSRKMDANFNTKTRTFSDKSCYSQEYADNLDVMGLQHVDSPMVSAPVWDAKKFGDRKEIRDITKATTGKSYTYTIKPWSAGGDSRAVKFRDPKTKEIYYLELRAPKGYDSVWAKKGNRGVKITRLDNSRPYATGSIALRPSSAPSGYFLDYNITWQAGKTFTTTGGTKVKINKVSDTSASVTITLPRA